MGAVVDLEGHWLPGATISSVEGETLDRNHLF